MRVTALNAVFLLVPGMAAALDCAAPKNSFLRNLCETPEAYAQWQVIEQSLQDTLAAAPDQAARDAIQASQDRWLGTMGMWDVDATRAALAARSDGGLDLNDDSDAASGSVEAQLTEVVALRSRQLPRLLVDFASAKADLARLAELSPPGFVLASDTGCFFVEPEVMPSGYWDGFCGGTLNLQRGARVCSVMTYWYSGHVGTLFSVDDLTDGKLTHLGHCEWDGLGSDCSDVGADEATLWETDGSEDVEAIHRVILNSSASPPSPLSPIDPESWSDIYSGEWFETCLTTEEYPPTH